MTNSWPKMIFLSHHRHRVISNHHGFSNVFLYAGFQACSY